VSALVAADVNHKRRRPRSQRAGCRCGGKEAKKDGHRALRGGNGRLAPSDERLKLRAQETD
jgi:hypothetical protein